MTPPPIASPHAVAEEVLVKAPFLGLRIFVAVDLAVLLSSLLNPVFSTHPHKSWAVTIGVLAVYIPLWCLLLWHLWRGSGVARAIFWWVNAVSLLLSLSQGFRMDWLPLWLQWLNYGGEAFLVFGLVWLHLPGVKAHFRRESGAVANEN